IFALEDRQFLFDFVLVDTEIILGQAVDKFAAIVEHTGVQNHQVHIGDDSSLLAGWRSRLGLWLAGRRRNGIRYRNLRRRRAGEQREDQ
ncbi:MAG: hypothetical protein WAM58_04070, partial [Candidatus Acidiferrum sp.]